MRAVVVGRQGSGFSHRDRAYAAHLQSLLLGVDRRLRAPANLEQEGRRLAAAARLTRREVEVLELLAQGRTAVAIARTLAITSHTVSKHQQNIYRKLGTNDRLTTVLQAQRLRLFEDGGR
jgi:DNA-binding NarL/FixJ family response regulator